MISMTSAISYSLLQTHLFFDKSPDIVISMTPAISYSLQLTQEQAHHMLQEEQSKW